MPISTKLVAVAASAAVLMTGAGVAIGATQSQTAPITAAAIAPVPETEIRVWADNATTTVSLPNPSVATAIEAAGVVLGEQDRVSPDWRTVLSAGDTVTIQRVSITQETKVVALEFATTEVKDETLAKGERKVKTKGVNGSREDVVQTVTVDGVVESNDTVSQTVTQEPVNKVVRVGTKVAPKVTSRSAELTAAPAKPAEPKKTSAPTTPAPAPKKAAEPAPAPQGGAIDLARADMWDRIAKCESGGNWAINTGNSYYGGLQFNLATWRSVNGTDFAAYPHQASRAEQITVANRLYAKRGLQPWGCRGAA